MHRGLAPVVLEHTLAAASIDDDVFVLWAPPVLGALSIGDLDLAERLVVPVATALPGGAALPPSAPSGTGCAACSPRPVMTTLGPSRQR